MRAYLKNFLALRARLNGMAGELMHTNIPPGEATTPVSVT
jgi:hypothetical protein